MKSNAGRPERIEAAGARGEAAQASRGTEAQFPGTQYPVLQDQAARAAALDTRRSFLVQAPAGSGKTELLIHRFLKLLAVVDEPEQVLAITFTLAATAEMRARMLDALEEARGLSQDPDQEIHCMPPEPLLAAAAAALRNDSARGWRLLEQPQRLNIQTIDSLCLHIAHQTPLLSRLGGSLTPTEHAEPLYALAARRTLARLGGEREDLSQAIRALLEARDTSLGDCERLIADMLQQRDQWGRVLFLGGEAGDEADWADARRRLEEPFVRERRRLIGRARNLFAGDPSLAEQLLELVEYACGNLEGRNPQSPMLRLKGALSIEDFDADCWTCLCDFLLTEGNAWRKKRNLKAQGFPTGKPGSEEAEAKQRYELLVEALKEKEGALERLIAIREMPPAEYSAGQWKLLRQILLILRYAAAELRVVFAEQGVVDFVEIGWCAREALRGDPSAEGGLPPAQPWRHLLVDEFQDTSRGQYELFMLLADHMANQWEEGRAATCFLVGDPMQSIYGFRQAEVELFERTRRYGLGSRFHLESLVLEFLVLETNFRSHAGLVDQLNPMFAKIFATAPGGDRNQDRYQVVFAPSIATRPAPPGTEGMRLSLRFLSSRAGREECLMAREAEAEAAVRAIQKAIAAGKGEEGLRIAVLARAKTHLEAIAQKLRHAGIPYRAIELEELSGRQEVLDLASLVRALFHPMDRIAWLSVLRAPWCGLTLEDLHTLCGQDAPELANQPVLQLLRMRIPLLSSDGQRRAARVSAVLEDALRGKRRQVSHSQWVERVWRSLGGRECVDGTGYENVRAFFRMLDELPPESAEFEQQTKRLFAEPDPRTDERSGLHLMTIHKAKGLSFDVVIVPGLERGTRDRDRPLLHWLERTTLEGSEEIEQREFLLAPIGRKGGDTEALYRWIERQKRHQESEEAKRLLYVACTRAREELHLLGAVRVKDLSGRSESSESIESMERSELLQPGRGQSLLKTAWPALEKRLAAQREGERRASAIGKAASSSEPEPKAGSDEIVSPPGRSSPKTIRLRRLPVDWSPDWERDQEAEPKVESWGGTGESPRLESPREESDWRIERPAGSLEARALGVAVHALFEELAASLRKSNAEELLQRIDGWRSRAVALLRQAGLPRGDAERLSAKAIAALKSALEDEEGRWILGARSAGETESSWTAWGGLEDSEEMPSTLRADRIFRAGAEPHSQKETHLWVVDYKTAQHGGEGLEAFLEGEREKYRHQLEAYGQVMRKVRGEELPLRLALYYPLLRRLLWWAPETF